MTKTVFFDLDGTLTDPMVGITTSIQYALEKLDVDIPVKDDLTWCIGPPLQKSLGVLVGKERAALALGFYRERFSDIGWKENVLYPGIEDTLVRLCGQGFRLFVATSKPHVFARRIIEHFQMGQYFDAIYGSELDGTRVEKTELLRFALSETQTEENATMVGDREHDIIGALANGMSAIGVTYGYGSPQELFQAGANGIVGRPADLVPALTGLTTSG
jgi:phosphoglycolate phosphatase